MANMSKKANQVISLPWWTNHNNMTQGWHTSVNWLDDFCILVIFLSLSKICKWFVNWDLIQNKLVFLYLFKYYGHGSNTQFKSFFIILWINLYFSLLIYQHRPHYMKKLPLWNHPWKNIVKNKPRKKKLYINNWMKWKVNFMNLRARWLNWRQLLKKGLPSSTLSNRNCKV